MSAPRASTSSQQLSQTAIDQMMGGEQAARPTSPRSSSDVQVYDFQRPRRVSKDRLRTLEAMYGRLVKLFGKLLQAAVGEVVRVPGIEQDA